MCSCSLERTAPFHKGHRDAAVLDGLDGRSSCVQTEGQNTMSNAFGDLEEPLSSMARVEMSQPPQEAAQYQASPGLVAHGRTSGLTEPPSG